MGRNDTPRAAERVPRAKTLSLPAFVPPQLALLVDKAPAGNDWLHEIKFDGYRGEIAVDGGRARFYTRRGLDWSAKFVRIIGAGESLKCRSALLDGELVALDEYGRSDFSKLQSAIASGRTGDLVYYAFDLLHLDGRELLKLPLLERKAALRPLLEGSAVADPIRYSDHVIGNGPAFFSASAGTPWKVLYRSGRTARIDRAVTMPG